MSVSGIFQKCPFLVYQNAETDISGSIPEVRLKVDMIRRLHNVVRPLIFKVSRRLFTDLFTGSADSTLTF